jgi:UDP-2-acetamido-3-amino-2,3-dideoxy-glucuronate N-acetyltransferase
MAVFNDVEPKDKLLLYEHHIDWIDRIPVPRKEDAKVVPFREEEPLRSECLHFLESLETRRTPRSDGEEGVRVLRILAASQQSLRENGRPQHLVKQATDYFVHSTSVVGRGCRIGTGTRIWHFCHVMEEATIGTDCSIGQGVFIGKGVCIGNNVKIQNNVSVFEGVTLEDGVFCGPSCVFTNVFNPRSLVPRKDEFRETLVKKGATIGANATIVCGYTLGRFSFIGAGAVVADNVPDYALVFGNPGRIQGWMCECGVRLPLTSEASAGEQVCRCPSCGRRYRKEAGVVSEQGQV